MFDSIRTGMLFERADLPICRPAESIGCSEGTLRGGEVATAANDAAQLIGLVVEE